MPYELRIEAIFEIPDQEWLELQRLLERTNLPYKEWKKESLKQLKKTLKKHGAIKIEEITDWGLT